MSILQNVLFGRSPGITPAILPVANFTADATAITQSNTVNFTDTSTVAPGGQAITSWTWSFAGGTPTSSNTQNPSVVYNETGSFNVSLTVANPSGSDTETKTNYIYVTSSGATSYVTESLQQYIDPFLSTWSGTTVYDLSPIGNHASRINDIVTGSDGWILNNTQDGSLRLGRPYPLGTNWPDGFTWEVWFKSADTSYESNVCLIAQWGGLDWPPAGSGLGNVIYVSNASLNVRGASWGDLGPTDLYRDTGNLATSTWHHIVYSLSNGVTVSPTQIAKIYLNGALVGTATSGSIRDTSNNDQIYAGGPPRITNGRYFNDANMGLTRIYNRQLTDAEVLQNYNANKADYGL